MRSDLSEHYRCVQNGMENHFRVIIRFLNSRTVKVFASCRTAVLRLVIFTLTLVQTFEISNVRLSLINWLSFIQSITYTKWLNKKKIWNAKEYC
jgi:hypothetical protein